MQLTYCHEHGLPVNFKKSIAYPLPSSIIIAAGWIRRSTSTQTTDSHRQLVNVSIGAEA